MLPRATARSRCFPAIRAANQAPQVLRKVPRVPLKAPQVLRKVPQVPQKVLRAPRKAPQALRIRVLRMIPPALSAAAMAVTEITIITPIQTMAPARAKRAIPEPETRAHGCILFCLRQPHWLSLRPSLLLRKSKNHNCRLTYRRIRETRSQLTSVRAAGVSSLKSNSNMTRRKQCSGSLGSSCIDRDEQICCGGAVLVSSFSVLI